MKKSGKEDTNGGKFVKLASNKKDDKKKKKKRPRVEIEYEMENEGPQRNTAHY